MHYTKYNFMKKFLILSFVLLMFGCQTSQYYQSSLTGPESKISTHENPNDKNLKSEENPEISAQEFINGENLSKITKQTKKAMEASMEVGPKTSDNISGTSSRRVVIQEYIQSENYDILIDKGKYDSFLVSLNFQNT